MQLGRFFLREQPAGTWIDYIHPWLEVQKDPKVKAQTMDQCMVGWKDDYEQEVKKPTEWTSNNETLVKPMRRFSCNGQHDHAHPNGKALEISLTFVPTASENKNIDLVKVNLFAK